MKKIFSITIVLLVVNTTYAEDYIKKVFGADNNLEKYPIFRYYDKEDLAPVISKNKDNSKPGSLQYIIANLVSYIEDDDYLIRINKEYDKFLIVEKIVYVDKIDNKMYVKLSIIGNSKKGFYSSTAIDLYLEVLQNNTYKVTRVSQGFEYPPDEYFYNHPEEKEYYVNEDIENELFDELQRKP